MPVLVNPYRFGAPAGGSLAAWLTQVLADSPWAVWKDDETTGTTLADSSGNSRPMTITGSPTLAQTGPDGGADAVSWPNATASAQTTATVTTSSCTWETFVYLAANPSVLTAIATVDAGGGIFDKALYVDTGGHPTFYIYDGVGRQCTSSAALSLNTWHHIAASVGADGMKVRVDKSNFGTFFPTASYTGAAMSPSIRNAPGAMNSSGTLDGTAPMLIGPTAFFTSQLSEASTDAHKDAMF